MPAKDFYATQVKPGFVALTGHVSQEISGRARKLWKTTQMSTKSLNNMSILKKNKIKSTVMSANTTYTVASIFSINLAIFLT